MVFYLRWFFILTGFCVLAQKNPDFQTEVKNLISLEQKKKASNKDIDKMLELVNQFSPQNPDEALFHLERIKRFIETNDYQDGLLEYCFNILKIYRIKTEVHKAEKIITEVNKKNDLTKKNQVSMQYLLADIANYKKEFDKSLQIAKRALPDAVTTFQKASLNYVIAGNYTETGNNKEALSYALKALELYKSSNDDKNISLIYNLMSVIYQQINNYEKAKYYGKLSLYYAEKINSLNNILDTYSNLVVSYRGLNEIDSAKYIFNKIIETAAKLDRPYTIAQARMNMGNLYSDEKDYKKAREQFEMSLALCQKYKINEGILYNYINLGSNYQAQKRYPAALIAYDSAVYYAKKVNAPPFMISYIYDGYTNLFENTGNYKKALENHRIMDSLNSVVNLEQSKKEIAEIQAKYDSAVKDAEIEKINNEYLIKRNQTRILFLLSAVVLLATVFTIVFLIYRNKKLRQLYARNVEIIKTINFSSYVESQQVKLGENEPLKKIFDEILATLENEKLYQNPDLTVNDMANEINSNQKYVSNAIATYANTNFNNLINFYRITEAKRLIVSREYPTLNEIMYACGFNSRTPFYNAFNKHTGMSPKQFKDISKSSDSDNMFRPATEALN